MDEIKGIIKKLTNKNHIVLFPRCDGAIDCALNLIKQYFKEKHKILIQDQGGWLSYKKLPKRYGFELIEIKTDYGLVDLEELKNKIDETCILLLNSMPGYHAFEDMAGIAMLCKENNTLLINDVSGSIGTEYAKIGDFIVGSFGKWKPVYACYGGFLASDTNLSLEDDFDASKIGRVKNELLKLKEKIWHLANRSKNIKDDLNNSEIIHRNKKGYNIFIKFKNPNEKLAVEDYCRKNRLEYAICPRYIRINEDAISIEVKRWMMNRKNQSFTKKEPN